MGKEILKGVGQLISTFNYLLLTVHLLILVDVPSYLKMIRYFVTYSNISNSAFHY